MAFLVSKDGFPKWSCFYMVWVKQAADFWIGLCVGVEGADLKLRRKESTSDPSGDGW